MVLALEKKMPQSSFFNPVIKKPSVPINLGVGYQNMYGTNIGMSVDPMNKNVEGNITIPIGDARSGLSFSARGSYGAAGPNGFVGFTKRNLSSDKNLAEQQLGLNDPNRNKYEYGLTVNDPRFTQPRMAGDALGLPSGLLPTPNTPYEPPADKELYPQIMFR